MKKISDFTKKYKTHICILIGVILYVIFIGDCLIKKYTGMPCPTCGLTRAITSLLKGDFRESLEYHLFAIPLMMTCCIYIYQLWINSNHKYFKYVYVFLGILLFAYYLYRMFTLFPSIEPMDYNYNPYIYLI